MELTIEQRRVAFIVLSAVAVASFIVALAATLIASASASAWLYGSAIVLVLALAGEIFLLVWGENKEFDEDGDWYEWEDEATPVDELLLRCPGCSETFTVSDSGERPLRHECPHCGRAGVIRGAAPGAGAASSAVRP